MLHSQVEELRRTVDSALAAGDPAAALAAVRPVARAVAAEDGAALRELVARLPDEAWQHDAVIAAALGASYRSPGSPRGAAALGYFQAAEAGLAERGRDADPERLTVWLGHSAALRRLGRLAEARTYVDRTRELDAPGGILSVPLRVELSARAALESGMLDLQAGAADSAREHLEFAHGLAGDLTLAERVECLGGLALVDYGHGRFDSAVDLVAEARTLAEGTVLLASGYGAPALAAEALVAVDRDELATAARVEAELLAVVDGAEWQGFAYVVAAARRLAERRLAAGLDFLQRARQEYRTWPAPGFGVGIGELLRAAILVSLDQGDEAWAILRDLDPGEHHLLCPARIVAQLRMRNGDLLGAADALRGCEELGDDHAPRTLVEARMMRAAIEFERGEFVPSDVGVDRALAAMSRTGSRAALRLVPPATLSGLVSRALTRPQSEEVRALLSELAAAPASDEPGIEPLSSRELLVLAEVEKGATVAGIASALFISPNTVKTHLRRLYRKLGVATRTDAIRKARSLGLGRQITR